MKLQDLQPFCSGNETRFGILEPFNSGAYTYATDGRILIRVPKIGEIAERSGQPKNPELVVPTGDGYTPVEFPPSWETFEREKRECEYCKGGGRQIKCRECHGSGDVECESCGHEESCPRCRGTGMAATEATGNSVPCEECDGTGENEVPFTVALNRGAVRVDLRYLRLAATLPNLRLSFLDETSALRMDFDGGEGAIMPRRARTDSGEEADAFAKQWPAVSAQR